MAVMMFFDPGFLTWFTALACYTLVLVVETGRFVRALFSIGKVCWLYLPLLLSLVVTFVSLVLLKQIADYFYVPHTFSIDAPDVNWNMFEAACKVQAGITVAVFILLLYLERKYRIPSMPLLACRHDRYIGL